MFHQVKLARNIDNVLASANEHGVMVVAGWTIAIPKESAVAYVKSYDSSPNAGFFEHDGQVILSHGPGKITLTCQEAQAVIDLIKAAYGPF